MRSGNSYATPSMPLVECGRIDWARDVSGCHDTGAAVSAHEDPRAQTFLQPSIFGQDNSLCAQILVQYRPPSCGSPRSMCVS